MKIGDFNASKVMKQQLMETMIGTPNYQAPEIWEQVPYGSKCDVWGLGCCLFELMALKPPFEADSMMLLKKKI